MADAEAPTREEREVTLGSLSVLMFLIAACDGV